MALAALLESVWPLYSTKPEVSSAADFIDNTEPARCRDLMKEVCEALWVLRHVMYAMSRLHNAGFRELEQLDDLKYGGANREFADFVVDDPSCNFDVVVTTRPLCSKRYPKTA